MTSLSWLPKCLFMVSPFPLVSLQFTVRVAIRVVCWEQAFDLPTTLQKFSIIRKVKFQHDFVPVSSLTLSHAAPPLGLPYPGLLAFFRFLLQVCFLVGSLLSSVIADCHVGPLSCWSRCVIYRQALSAGSLDVATQYNHVTSSASSHTLITIGCSLSLFIVGVWSSSPNKIQVFATKNHAWFVHLFPQSLG